MNYTKFETARLIGSRALMIKMGAPVLVKVPKSVEKPIDIARLELQHNVLPLTVKEREEKYIKRKKVVLPEIPVEEEEAGEVKEVKEAPEEEVIEEEVIVSDESD
jgi:DNA-directed RNA polymerase subunit K/omega